MVRMTIMLMVMMILMILVNDEDQEEMCAVCLFSANWLGVDQIERRNDRGIRSSIFVFLHTGCWVFCVHVSMCDFDCERIITCPAVKAQANQHLVLNLPPHWPISSKGVPF